MSDRELLELAAKVAGRGYTIGKDWHDVGQIYVDGRRWDPLDDDGDALRLAVTLGMVVHIDLNYCRCAEVEAENGVLVILDFEEGADKFAVTRRAIVRAAAEIGKAAP